MFDYQVQLVRISLMQKGRRHSVEKELYMNSKSRAVCRTGKKGADMRSVYQCRLKINASKMIVLGYTPATQVGLLAYNSRDNSFVASISL